VQGWCPFKGDGVTGSKAGTVGGVQLVLPPRNRDFTQTDAMAVVGAFGFLVARFIPVARLLPFWGCTFRRMTGIPCPGCGLTRVADRFAHLNLLGALHANPLGTVAAAGFAVAIVLSSVHLTLGVPLPELVLDAREWRVVRWAAVALFAVNYLWVVFAYTQLGYR
jgi:Protein of unknown function (DUF2752)